MAELCDLPLISAACKAPGHIVGAIVGSAFDTVANEFAQSVSTMAKTVLTSWTAIPTPGQNLADAAGTPTGTAAFLRDHTSWLTALTLIISLMIAGARMAMTGSWEPGRGAAKGLLQFTLYSALALPVIAIAGVAGDGFTNWILNAAGDGDIGTRVEQWFSLTADAGTGPGMLGPPVVFILALFALLSGLTQLVLMIARAGVLVLLAGMIPFAAATAVNKGGGQSLAKQQGWLLAWLAYKPAAGIGYAAALQLAGHGQDFVDIISGIVLTGLSVLALPALIRLTVPAAEAIASGGSNPGIGAAAGGMIPLATGALALRAGSGSRSSGTDSSNSAAPTGAPATSGTPRPRTSSTAGGGAGAAAGAAGAALDMAGKGAATVRETLESSVTQPVTPPPPQGSRR